MKQKPIIQFSENKYGALTFKRDGNPISEDEARKHWEALDADWSQGAYREMAQLVMQPKEAA